MEFIVNNEKYGGLFIVINSPIKDYHTNYCPQNHGNGSVERKS